MFNKINTLLILIFFLLPRLINSQDIIEEEFSKLIEGDETAFILYDKDNDQVYRYNPEGCSTQFRPAHTFSILIALIGLETGAVKNENDTIKWNKYERRIEVLNKDHTLTSAVQYSVLWYFQEVAKRIGFEKMKKYLNEIGYGNAAIGTRIEAFWLDGNLKITPDDQLKFLKQLYDNDLPFSPKNINIVRNILTLENTDNYTLRGITGAGIIRSKGYQGWFVGYLETNENTYIFIMNKKSYDPDRAIEYAVDKTKEILTHFNLMKDNNDTIEEKSIK